ncbi:MAG TPA: SDR family oxidoreductase [Gaiellaceae bacterium]|nr:SDR family oxidoreductase [Gaiellaceae bacterium]
MSQARSESLTLHPSGAVAITGASGGVGSAVARALAPQAPTLVLMDRTPPEELASELSGCRCIPIGVDIADAAATEIALEEAAVRAGGISHLVHCAAVLRMSPVAELTAEEFEEVLRINTVAAFVLARWIAERAVGGGGIVFISSVSGLLSGTNSLAYSASKRALHSITQALAIHYGEKGIRVNALCPGSMETGIWTREVDADMRERLGGANARDFLESARQESALGVLPTAEHVAELVLLLLRDAGSAVSGQIYTIWGNPLGS